MEINKQRIAELVAKIQSGDNSAFDELYKLTSERAYFVALEFTKNNQDAEDILQESYIKALSKINELDKPESFSSWLNQIVANKSKDFLKKKKPMLFEAEENEAFEVLPDEDTSFSPEANLDQTELQKAVMEVLDELSEEKRACVLMMYFEELSVGEIAETLEIPEGTVKTRLFSARKDIKDKFEKRGITSLYSAAPIGVVIWALCRMSDAISETFVASGASAKVFSGITVAGAGSATSAAAAGTMTSATASAAGTGAATAAVAGTGIAAKIAALTVAQKIVAGVSVAVVVAGGTVGVITVADKNGKADDVPTTAYTEEYTTVPSFETILAVDVLGTVEFSGNTESTDASATTTVNLSEKVTRMLSGDTPSDNYMVYSVPVSEGTPLASIVVTLSGPDNKTAMNLLFHVPAGEVMTESYLSSLCEKLGYYNVSDISGYFLGETAQANEFYNFDALTPKPISTNFTTTKSVNTTRADVPVVGYTIPVNQGDPIARVVIMIMNSDGTPAKKLFFAVPAGEVLTESYLFSLCEKLDYNNVSDIRGDALGESAQANGTYNFEATI